MVWFIFLGFSDERDCHLRVPGRILNRLAPNHQFTISSQIMRPMDKICTQHWSPSTSIIHVYIGKYIRTMGKAFMMIRWNRQFFGQPSRQATRASSEKPGRKPLLGIRCDDGFPALKSWEGSAQRLILRMLKWSFSLKLALAGKIPCFDV